MHRITLGLLAFLLVFVPATASVAQQRDRLPEAPLRDCGYVCVFAQSTDPVQDLDRSAQVGKRPSQRASAPSQMPFSQVIPPNFAGTDWVSLTDF